MGEFLRIIREKRNLRIRIIIIFLILIYIPMALNIYFVYTRTLDTIESEKIKDTEQILKKTSESIDFTLISIEEAIGEVANQNGVKKGVEDLENLTQSFQEKIINFIGRKSDEVIESNQYIESIICVTDRGKSFSFGREALIDSEEFFSSDIYNQIEGSQSKHIWEYIDEKILKSEYIENKMILVNKIESIDGQKTVGYLFAIVNESLFQSLYQDISLGITGNMSIYDGEEKPVLGSMNYPIPQNMFKELINNNQYYTMTRVDSGGKEYFIGIAPLRPLEWNIKTVVPVEELTASVKKSLKSSFWIIISISILLAIWIIIEVIVLTKVITEREMAHYRLVLSEEMNAKLRVYKHDFMNHLQIIRGLIELDRGDRALEYLKNVTKEGAIIRDRYEIGIPELESVIFTAISEAKKHDIDIEIEAMKLSDSLPIKIYDLTKILTNLIKNAMYALQSSDEDEKKLKIMIYEELDEYIFEVINNTPVIPMEIRSKIFKKGFSTKGKMGNGLGLYIVEKIVKKNNGLVELKVDDMGNHFIVRFPCN